MKKIFLLTVMVAVGCPAHAETYKACREDKERLEARSKELAALVKADQDERSNWEGKTTDERWAVAKRDVDRRKRVGEIFGEGCFSKAEDYAAAALVYQHGDTPDHFFQTFIWAQRAVELGDTSQKRLMAMAIDRYLVNKGQKQIFASQASMPNSDKPDSCWCLDQVEKSFSDSRRKEFFGRNLAESFAWVKGLNKEKKCPSHECEAQLKPSPEGAIPGFW